MPHYASEENQLKRRELLRSSALAGAGLMLGHKTASAAAHNASATQPSSSNSPTILSRERILGRGDAALTVSALSLGCMGMHGGRGRTPDETMMEKLIRQAYDRGCTFFDTAEGYPMVATKSCSGAPSRRSATRSSSAPNSRST